jgi:hypothetical protein
MSHSFVKEISCTSNFVYRYTICTLVTKLQEYNEMVSSCVQAGFSPDLCEYLYINNIGQNVLDAYQGTNLFLKNAKGKYVIICHQDVLFNKSDIDNLDERLKELDSRDPKWALAGNAGAAGPNHIVYHISYPNNIHMNKGNYPVKVSALDENFLLVKNDAMLSVSSDLVGFHLYATDLCLHAELLGFTSYAIAFNITHKSRGNVDQNFRDIRKSFQIKYNRYFRNRWIQTPSTVFYLSGSVFAWFYGNPIALFFVRMYNGLMKRKK